MILLLKAHGMSLTIEILVEISPRMSMHNLTSLANFGIMRPFCIMLLYQYLLHYGLLLHIMSQYLCLFSLILQGLHEEGECR